MVSLSSIFREATVSRPHIIVPSKIICAFFLSYLFMSCDAWLIDQTRRDILFGFTWTAASSLTLAEPSSRNQPATTGSATTTVIVKEKAKQLRQQEKERERIARETKARLAAGRIGTI
jgi:hypothetical protein